MAENARLVIMGADTHKQFHTVAVITASGERLGNKSFDANAQGYKHALIWARSFGKVEKAGIESCGTYGAGLCAYLKNNNIEAFDVYAPDKTKRRRHGKSDTEDAFQVAEATLVRERCSHAKDTNAALESLNLLKMTYAQTIKQRTASINALKAAIVGLPDSLRSQLRNLTTQQLIKTCCAFRTSADVENADTKLALRVLAKRIKSLDAERALLDKEIKKYADTFLPHTSSLQGVAHHGATTLLCATGLNIERIRNESAFSMLCGTSPLPVSTANSYHHRLNTGGNRKANSAIYTMAIVRAKLCKKTQAFIEKKMAEGKSKKDAIRILKRYLAREVYDALKTDIAELNLANSTS